MIDSKVFKRQASLTCLKGKFITDPESDLDILLFYVNNSYNVVNFIFDTKSGKVIFPEFLESIVDDIIEVYKDLVNGMTKFDKEYYDDSYEYIVTGDLVKELTDNKVLLLSEKIVDEFLKGKNIKVQKGYEYKLIKQELSDIVNTKMTRGVKNYKTHPSLLDLSEYKDYKISEFEDYIVRSTVDGREHYTLLTGDPGTGKSTIAKVFAYKEDIPVYQMQFSNGTDEEGALCGVIPNTEDPNGTPWLRKESVLLFAMRHGGLVILDEINKAPTSMTSTLNSILDDNASYTTDTGEVIHLHKDFRLIATMNPKVENMVNDSTVNRFRVFRIQPLSDKQIESRLLTQLPELENNGEMAKILINHYNKVNSELCVRGKILNTPRNLLALASNILELNTIGSSLAISDRENCIINLYKANLIEWLDVNYIADTSEYSSLYSLVETLAKELHSKIIVQEKEDRDLGITINVNLNNDINVSMLQELEDTLRADYAKVKSM